MHKYVINLWYASSNVHSDTGYFLLKTRYFCLFGENCLFQFFIFIIDIIDKWMTTKFEDKKYSY